MSESRSVLMIVAMLSIPTIVPAPANAQDEADMMVARLTPHHEVFKRDVGTWDVKMKFWPQGPGSEPSEAQATETNRLLGDGAWLISDFEAQFGPTKFTGHGQFGYDNVKKQYVGTWVDSANTHMSTMSGTFDSTTNTMEFLSKGYNDTVGAETTSRMVTRYHHDGTHVMEMYMRNPDGSERKTMELHYEKRSD